MSMLDISPIDYTRLSIPSPAHPPVFGAAFLFIYVSSEDILSGLISSPPPPPQWLVKSWVTLAKHNHLVRVEYGAVIASVEV